MSDERNVRGPEGWTSEQEIAARRGIEEALRERIRALEAELANTRHRWIEADGERATLKTRAEKAEADLAAALVWSDPAIQARFVEMESEIRNCPCADWHELQKRAAEREAGKEPTVPHSPPFVLCTCGLQVHNARCPAAAKPAARHRSVETQECGT